MRQAALRLLNQCRAVHGTSYLRFHTATLSDAVNCTLHLVCKCSMKVDMMDCLLHTQGLPIRAKAADAGQYMTCSKSSCDTMHSYADTGLLCCLLLQQSGAVISQLLIPPTNLPQPNSTTRASRKSESLAARIRRAAMPAKVTLTEEAAKAWRLRDQREWAQSQRTAKIAAAGASADESRGKGPRVNMKAVFASYETKRQKHDTNLFEAFQRVRSTLRQ